MSGVSQIYNCYLSMKSLAAFQSYSAPLQHHHDLPGVVLHDNFQLRRPSLTPNHQSLLHHSFNRRSSTRRRRLVILQKWNADVEQGTSIQSRNDNSTDPLTSPGRTTAQGHVCEITKRTWATKLRRITMAD